MAGYADNFNIPATAVAYKVAADNFNLAEELSSTPSTPTDFSATPLDGAALLTWTQPTTGASPTGYRVEATTGTVTLSYLFAAPATTVALIGLTNTETWTLTLYAVAEGSESDGVDATVTPDEAAGGADPEVPSYGPEASVPSAPVLTEVVASNTMVNATWTEPHDGGAVILKYLLQATLGAEVFTQEFPGGTTNGTIGGLTNDVAYEITVVALNEKGASPASNMLSATPIVDGPIVIPPPGVVIPEPPPRIMPPSIIAFEPTTPFAPSYWVGL